MAIERMKLLSIVGKENTMDTFISKYLLNSGLQPEDALKVYEKGWNLSCYSYNSEIRDTLKSCKAIMNKLEIDYSNDNLGTTLEYNLDKIKENLEMINSNLNASLEKEKQAKENIEKLEGIIQPLSKLKDVKVNLKKLYDLEYIRFRYGKVPIEYYEKLSKEIEKKDVIVFEVSREDNYAWIMYFTTVNYETNVDSYFNVMKFERTWLPEEITGIPSTLIEKIEKQIIKSKQIIENENSHQIALKSQNTSMLLFIYNQLVILEKINNVKKYIVHDKNGNFYVIGWIPTSELKEIMPRLTKEKDIQYKVKNHDEVASNPPTHLKNNKIIQKFESIVEMYGIPNYTETDPTTFVAITSFIMFGFMFGDVGQGFVIAVIGAILSKMKKSLGPVLFAGGISAMIFGVLYGSIFGKEGIIPSILISPMENITTMLISGIAFGAILIIIAMIINIKNGIKNKDKKKIFFSENGMAGLLFYLVILSAIVYYFIKGKLIVSVGILAGILIFLLVIIMFKDKLANLLSNKKDKTKNSVVEKIFEIIEMLLSTVSNTISFVRLAAFAINHVGLCMAVYILSNMATGAGNIAILVIGNAVVIVLEGLIVAIQVLRLEYYELFSRFYLGDGKKYRPIKSEIEED